MAGWQVAYWGDHGVDVYRMDGDGHAEKLYSGPLDDLKPVQGGRPRRVLILGRSRCIRLRKHYPPAKMDKLLRAVEIEAPSLFPMSDCSFHCRVVGKHETHVVVDIWAWERNPVERLQSLFAFRYAVPEDLAFLASPAGIYIYPSGAAIQLVACGEGRFMDAASYPAAGFSKTDLDRFLAGLGDDAERIREIRFYGDTAVDIPSGVTCRVAIFPEIDRPPFLKEAARLPLRTFRLNKGIWPQFLDKRLLFRFALYAVLAYGLMLFLTLRDYDKALADLKSNTLKMEKELALQEHTAKSRSDPEVTREFEAKMREAVSPLRILDILAVELPEESYLKSLRVNGDAVEVMVAARNPSLVMKQLGGSAYIRKANLRGSPTKETSSGIYSFPLLLEMKP